jgi:acyl carrier protein
MNEATAHTVVCEVLATIAPEVDLDTVDAGAPLQDEIDLDSMNFLDLMAGIHERTGIDIPERDYPEVTTLADCISYLCRHASV